MIIPVNIQAIIKKKAVENGIEGITDALQEEAAELIVALNKYRRATKYRHYDPHKKYAELASEVADVLFMIEQLLYHLDMDHAVTSEMFHKTNRMREKLYVPMGDGEIEVGPDGLPV